jgi:hypothetical protein
MAVEIQQTELMLRLGMTLLCRSPIMGGCIGEVGENPVPTRVKEPQAIRGVRVPSGRR